jgi:hypothetical protein
MRYQAASRHPHLLTLPAEFKIPRHQFAAAAASPFGEISARNFHARFSSRACMLGGPKQQLNDTPCKLDRVSVDQCAAHPELKEHHPLILATTQFVGVRTVGTRPGHSSFAIGCCDGLVEPDGNRGHGKTLAGEIHGRR